MKTLNNHDGAVARNRRGWIRATASFRVFVGVCARVYAPTRVSDFLLNGERCSATQVKKSVIRRCCAEKRDCVGSRYSFSQKQAKTKTASLGTGGKSRMLFF